MRWHRRHSQSLAEHLPAIGDLLRGAVLTGSYWQRWCPGRGPASGRRRPSCPGGDSSCSLAKALLRLRTAHLATYTAPSPAFATCSLSTRASTGAARPTRGSRRGRQRVRPECHQFTPGSLAIFRARPTAPRSPREYTPARSAERRSGRCRWWWLWTYRYVGSPGRRDWDGPAARTCDGTIGKRPWMATVFAAKDGRLATEEASPMIAALPRHG